MSEIGPGFDNVGLWARTTTGNQRHLQAAVGVSQPPAQSLASGQAAIRRRPLQTPVGRFGEPNTYGLADHGHTLSIDHSQRDGPACEPTSVCRCGTCNSIADATPLGVPQHLNALALGDDQVTQADPIDGHLGVRNFRRSGRSAKR